MTAQACGALQSLLPEGWRRGLQPSGGEAPPPFVPLSIPADWLWQSWSAYCSRFVQADGRVVDFQRESITTSEGQAYALMRAVWLGDSARFSQIWGWTRNNLLAGHRPDALMPWKWGRQPAGGWGVLDVHSAADADVLLAFVLLAAGKRFGQVEYERAAEGLLESLWRVLVLQDPPHFALLPGDWRADGPLLRMNPSYQLLFAFRTFAARQPDRGWERVLREGMRQLGACRSQVGLPVDWCGLDPADGLYQVEGDPAHPDSHFGFEALRVPWNLVADALWSGAPRPALLEELARPLLGAFRRHGRLPAVWQGDGKPAVTYTSLALYGACLPVFQWIEPRIATSMLEKCLRPTYQDGLWHPRDDYYGQNWAWFGLALASGLPWPG